MTRYSNSWRRAADLQGLSFTDSDRQPCYDAGDRVPMMKAALNMFAHQLRLPVKSWQILMGVVVLAVMTFVMGFLEFTHRRAWIGPVLSITAVVSVAPLIVQMILFQRRIRRASRPHRDMRPPGEMVGMGIPIGPNKPSQLSAHAVPPNQVSDESDR